MAKLKTSYADELPPLASNDAERLRLDIAAHGIKVPIEVDQAGNILDGHHRYRFAKDKAKVPVQVIKGLSEVEKLPYIWRSADNRRNLSPDQKRDLDTKRKAWAKARRAERPPWSEKRIGEVLGVARNTVSVWLSGHSVKDDTVSLPDSRVKVPAKSRSILASRVAKGKRVEQVAADYGITPRHARRIADQENKPRPVKAPPPLPEGKYDLLYADPPWQYDFSETHSREIENKYPTMTVEAICALNVPAAENACLFLWVTAPKLREGLRVLDSWGFTYRTHAVWDKGTLGMGYWFRGQHELLLVATKGQFSPPAQKLRVSSILRYKRTRHSVKPIEVYKLLEYLFPEATKYELFLRGRVQLGWQGGWGNEAE